MRTIQQVARVVAIAAIILVCASRHVAAQQTTVSLDSGTHLLYSNAALTNALTAGAAATLGDGAVLRLGYYSSATVASPFSGTFVPLTGAQSANSAYTYTSIGDAPANGAGADGTFALILSFASNSTTTGNNLPTAGMPLAIQFYNSTALSTATYYNAASDALWLWQTPATPGPTVQTSLDQTGLTWLGGTTSAFYTALPVPEPSSLMLGGIALAGLGWTLQRRKRNA